MKVRTVGAESCSARSAAIVFSIVLIAQLWLISAAGTDVPWLDAWDIEGKWLYPGWLAGRIGWLDLLRAHNDHRILWTHLENLALFSINGQWDPLVQLVFGAFLRAGAAAVIAAAMEGRAPSRPNESRTARRPSLHFFTSALVIFAFLPHLAWHNALWGFQSQMYYALLFSTASIVLLVGENSTPRRFAAGLACGCAAGLAMGAGALVGVALLPVAAIRVFAERRNDSATRWIGFAGIALLVIGLLSRIGVAGVENLRPQGIGQLASGLGRMLAWPYSWMPLAAIPMNLPILIAVVGRLRRRRAAIPGEDVILALASWSVACAAAIAWSRGGSAEFAAGVPSRYVDLIVLFPLSNAWYVVALATTTPKPEDIGRRRARLLLCAAWLILLAAAYAGLSATTLRGIILPRMRDRDAPVRIMNAYQASHDASAWATQPRLLVPHEDHRSVDAVLDDPSLRGHLPPSLQPDQPVGPLSRFARFILGW